MKKSFSKSTGNPGLLILIKLVIIFSSTYLHGQNQSSWLDEHVDHKIRKTKLLQAEEYQPTPNQDKFDVGYYGLDLSIQPATQTISGAVDVLAYPLADSLAIVELNLSDNFMVKAVLTGNDSLEFAHNNNILRITLDHYYLFNEQIEVAINYNGCPHTTGFGSFSFDLFNGRPMIWSLSEPFGARNWWPCKDLPSDKADSVDIRITVPKGLIVASNGLLKEVITAGETSTYCWHESYPIATYLVSVAIHDYHTYSDYYKYSETDSMEIQFYVFPEHSEAVRANYAQTAGAIEFFSSIFGPYPFLKEKYGHAEFLWRGGMEHQTITSLGGWSVPLIVHELAHQWWGDMVTCRDFHHIWLNEGFATYSEALYWEHFYGRTEYLKDLESKMYFGPGTIYVEDVSNINRVFDTGLSYHKACWVLHILRHVLGDETFFNVLKAYASDSRFKYGTAVTEDFREICETTSGMDLNWFFEQWIYSEYYPVYFYRWEIVEQGNQYLLKLIIEQKQRRTGLFKMPIDITITTEVGDKTYVVWDSLQTQTFEIVMNDKPVNVYLDRDNWILKEIYKPAANRPGFYLDQSYPNPLYLTQSNKAGQSPLATIGYQLYYPGQVSLKIYNTLGQLVVTLVNERQPADFYQVKWNCRNSKGQLVSSGVYVYELVVEGDRATEKMTVMR